MGSAFRYMSSRDLRPTASAGIPESYGLLLVLIVETGIAAASVDRWLAEIPGAGGLLFTFDR